MRSDRKGPGIRGVINRANDVAASRDFIDLQQLVKGQIFFVEGSDQEEVFHQEDLIQLQPFGVSLSADVQRPFLLLKDATGQHTLPVAMHPLEAGLSVQQGNGAFTASSPYKLVDELIKSLQIQFLQCVFVQIKGPVQYVRLYMSGHPSLNSLKLRADEAMAACLHFGVPIFATKNFIAKSKILNAQIEGLQGQLLKNQKVINRNHPRLM